MLEPLDLGEIEAAYASERGQPPFNPAMTTALLLYGYCNGVYSSRRIAKAARERVDFLSIVRLDPPDFRTDSIFRKRHLKALAGLFGQVLKLCEQAGLVKLGHVALDGTKIKANASKHKAMSYERMERRAAELEAEVERWLSAAEAADAEEDRAFGRDKSGEELPKWVADKKKRVEKIRAAKAELEAEAKAAAAPRPKRRPRTAATSRGLQETGRARRPAIEEPDPKAQKNSPDPESRIMKTKDGFIQGYNAQAAVDATAQVIVAHGLDAKQSDQHQLRDGRRHRSQSGQEADRNCRRSRSSAATQPYGDGGTRYRRQIARCGPSTPGKDKRWRPRRRHARKNQGRRALQPLPLKKQLPEPVFGQIKQAAASVSSLAWRREGRQRAGLVCLAHNISKLAQGGPRPWPSSQPAQLRHLGNGATNDGRQASTQSYIKPDARICCIRLSDWLARFESHPAGD